MTGDLSLIGTADLAASADPKWNALFVAWVRRQALSRANEKFGPMAKSADAAGLVEMEVEAKFGKGWRGIPEAREAYGPVFDRVREQDEAIANDFYHPQTDAAVALAMHPAPNVTAALFKIEMIEREELDNYLPMPRDPWEIVTEDMARLTGEIAPWPASD